GRGRRFAVAPRDAGNLAAVVLPEQTHFAGDRNSGLYREFEKGVIAANSRVGDDKVGLDEILLAMLAQDECFERAVLNCCERVCELCLRLKIGERNERAAVGKKANDPRSAAKASEAHDGHAQTVVVEGSAEKVHANEIALRFRRGKIKSGWSITRLQQRL